MKIWINNNKQGLLYLLLTLLISVPFYFLNYLNVTLQFQLPISATMIIVPMLVATFLTWGEHKQKVASLFNVFDVTKIAKKQYIWLLVSLLLVPFYVFTSYYYIEKQSIFASLNVQKVFQFLLGFIFFFFGAILEEIGWTNYATRKFIKTHTVFYTGLIIGIVWELWHFIPFLMIGKQLDWILFNSIVCIGYRVIMVHIFSKTNATIFPALLFHTMINLVPEMLPNGYAGYYPKLICALVWATIGLYAIFSMIKKLLMQRQQ